MPAVKTGTTKLKMQQTNCQISLVGYKRLKTLLTWRWTLAVLKGESCGGRRAGFITCEGMGQSDARKFLWGLVGEGRAEELKRHFFPLSAKRYAPQGHVPGRHCRRGPLGDEKSPGHARKNVVVRALRDVV